MTLIREYEPADFTDVEYLEFWPDPLDCVENAGRNEQGYLRLQRPSLECAVAHGGNLHSVIFGEIIVPQDVRDRFLASGFRHLMFQPTVLVTGEGLYEQRIRPIPWEQFEVTQPWWELTSDVVLPPLSPTMDLRNWKSGEPFRPADRLVRCHAKDGFYNHAERHYRRSELARLESFDVALTFENFGSSHTPSYGIVVSKRFHDCCTENNLKGRWAPVRIDED